MTLKMSKTLSNENSINKTSDEWFKPEIDRKVHNIDSILSYSKNEAGEYLISESKISKLREDLDKLKRRKYRIQASIDKKEDNLSVYQSSDDDIVVQEIHLVKDQPYTFKFRSISIFNSNH